MASFTKSPSEVPETAVRCGGECGRVARVVDAKSFDRPLLRVLAGVLAWVDLNAGHGWEFDTKARAWFCLYCRRRRRLLKVLN
jgi:hypothetical protein